MVHQPITALTCPACGGPVTDYAAQHCGFCGVALIVPEVDLATTPASDVKGRQRELDRLREQLRSDPSRAETHRRLGHAYAALGLADDAVRALTVAVGLAPEHTGTRLELATLLASRSAAGEPDAFPAAMRHVRQVLAMAPESTDARLLLARLLTQRGDFDDARTTLGQTAGLPRDDLRPRTAWVTLAEAATHERRGDRTAAVAAWRRAAADAPDLVRPAVVGFLDRSTPASHVVVLTHHSGSVDWPSHPTSPRWRFGLTAVAGGLAALMVGSSWMVALPVTVVALVPLLWMPRSGHGRETRTLARRHDSETSLADLLWVAALVASRMDAQSRSVRDEWADNLTVELVSASRLHRAVRHGRPGPVRWPDPRNLPEQAG